MADAGDRAGPTKVGYELVVDESTGSARIEVTVPLTVARAMTPRVAMVGGGGGNSIVGHGWSVAVAEAVRIDTSEHVPRWDGGDNVALSR